MKKAIKILNWLIEQETKRAEEFVDPKHSWNQEFDCMRDLAKSLVPNQQEMKYKFYKYSEKN